MPTPPRRKAPATAGLARRLYAEGATLAEIQSQTGLARPVIYYWIDREVAPDGTVTLVPMPRRGSGPAGAGQGTGAVEAQRRHGAAAKEPRKLPPAKATRRSPSRKGASPRERLLDRLWRAAERQVAEIEARIRGAGLDPDAEDSAPRTAADTEKDARALALLARTLRELSAAEGEGATKPGKAAADHDLVRDLDVFRRELARRLDRLREGGSGPEPAG